MSKNHTSRVGEEFNKELDLIKKKRIELGIDKRKTSTRKLTNLITKHNLWREVIRKELIYYRFKKNKKNNGVNGNE